MVTQAQLANQMLAQLRVLDPSVSLEIGTPERKIIDTVAQALSDGQVDLNVLQGALNLDSKYGSNLEAFLSLFGFSRQTATRATGFVTFSRISSSTVDIKIPGGTQVATATVGANDGGNPATIGAIYTTDADAFLTAGDLEVDVPITCSTAGTVGNCAAGQVTVMVSQTFGVTDVTNELAIKGGQDSESDDEFKVRFKNTVFRNLAGTQDQFLALAISTAFTTKANVVGPISRYREYVQVPPSDDTTSYDVDEDAVAESGDPGGSKPAIAGEYTTALSTIPYSKHTYTEVPYFVSTGNLGADTVFFRSDIDFRLNTAAIDKDRGDAHRFAHVSSPPNLDIDPTSAAATYRPNLTFTAVYNVGTLTSADLIRKGGVYLFEHSYVSTASRNDYDRNVTNCVDVFIDGGNNVPADTVIPTPGPTPASLFVSDATSKYYNQNFARHGLPQTHPTLGAFYVPLYWQPVTSLPESITISGLNNSSAPITATYYLNTHYFLVDDVTDLHGTVRARNGIEWLISHGQGPSDPDDGPYTGAYITDFAANQAINITGYEYDKNIVDLQAALEGSKQVTTDVLAHKAKLRYFKLDITIMYSAGSATTEVNQAIQSAVSTFLAGQYFGTVIQLSDLLQIVHNVSGVDNVRWSSDVPGSTDLVRVQECGADGVELSGGDIDNDFFLHDDELPALPDDAITNDTLPGLIIRARAQNTWIRG